jgi:hypothetical protein
MRDIERLGPYGIKRRVLGIKTNLSDFIGKRHKRVFGVYYRDVASSGGKALGW